MGHAYADLDQVMTGEAVALELPPASLGLHLLSGLLDVAIAVVVLIVGSIGCPSWPRTMHWRV